MGVRPVWERASGRVTGFEIMPASVLDRPRVDVTLRVSGFFRDAFPSLIDLVDSAARAVAALDEPPAANPLAARFAADRRALEAQGVTPDEAARRAGYRVFGSKPGAYGAGLQTLDRRADLGGRGRSRRYLARLERLRLWRRGRGPGRAGDARTAARAPRMRCCTTRTIASTICSTATTITSSRAGWPWSCRRLSGRAPAVWHNDHSRPERPVIRSLREEIGRVVRGRAANPRWIAGVMRHGYKGAAEIAATVDYLFAFAATARAVDDAHFDALYDAYLADDERARLYGRAQSGCTRRNQPAVSRSDRSRLVAPAPQQRPRGADAMERRVSDPSSRPRRRSTAATTKKRRGARRRATACWRRRPRSAGS